MKLAREVWNDEDVKEFLSYLITLKGSPEKCAWEKRIVNTALPCLAIKSAVVNQIVKEIAMGNYEAFLEQFLWENHTCTLILGGLISKIKDFEKQKHYLLKYSSMADNWATIDTIKIKANKNNVFKYLELAKEFVKSPKPFVRRMGIIILLKICKFDGVAQEILNVSSSLYCEQHYYVNMANAWLLCEMYIHYPKLTLDIVECGSYNRFTLNAFVQKCRDSYRVGKENKEMLLKFKK